MEFPRHPQKSGIFKMNSSEEFVSTPILEDHPITPKPVIAPLHANATPVSPDPSTVSPMDPSNTGLKLSDLDPDLVRALRRCTALVLKAEARVDPALAPLISRYYTIIAGTRGQVEYVGPRTTASIDELAGEIERVLESGAVEGEVREVDTKGVDLGKKDWDYWVDVEKKERKKRRCVIL